MQTLSAPSSNLRSHTRVEEWWRTYLDNIPLWVERSIPIELDDEMFDEARELAWWVAIFGTLVWQLFAYGRKEGMEAV